MSITRINEFRAKDGSADALLTFLTRLIPTIAAIPGCQSCQLLQRHDEPTRFIVLEVWESIEAHQASVKDISSESLAELMALLDGRPAGAYYHEQHAIS
jgi:quinol monooxygenase YgiN